MHYETKTLSDYLGVLRRRRVVVLSSIVSISLIGVVIAHAIPAMYQSVSRFLIEQQAIPQDVVQSTVNSFVDEQIQEVRTRVMSSGNIAALIEKHQLYPEIRSSEGMQVAVEKLRADTLLQTEVFDVMNPRSGRPMMATISFTLSFDHRDAQTARDVAADLANLYISQNVESRTSQVEQTLTFIQGDIDRYRQEVSDTGEALARFKEENFGNLPELMGHNLQTIERTERQIDGLDQEIRDARNRQLELGSQLAQLRPAQTVYDSNGQPVLNPSDQLAALQLEKMRLISVYSREHPDVVQVQKEIDILSQAVGGTGTYVATLNERVQQARAQHAENLQRYSTDHPDVLRSQRTLENLEAELADARLASSTNAQSQASLLDDPYARQLRVRMDAEETNIRNLQQRKNELQQKLQELELSVAMSPAIERDYENLTRANQTAVANLNEALAKLDAAQKAQKLEAGGSGDRFTIVEPAKVPLEPYKPNRTAIILLAFVLSCGVGLVLAMFLDALDDTVKGTRDVIQLIDTPPLAVIPYLETAAESRKRTLVNGMMAASVVGAIAVAYLITLISG